VITVCNTRSKFTLPRMNAAPIDAGVDRSRVYNMR
jgi:hypothetical protein